MSTLASAVRQARRQRRLAVLAETAAQRAWSSGNNRALVATITALQAQAVRDAETAVDDMLAEQDMSAPAVADLQPGGFAGVASDGRPLGTLFEQAGTVDALQLMAKTQVSDVARVATGVAAATRPGITGHVRHISPPTCSRCAILAGRFYRWSSGFARHPGCDCVMVPTTEQAAPGLVSDPMEAYRSGMVRGLSKADIRAIDDGADFAQVVNVRRASGLSVAGRVLQRGHRLTPEGIYRIAGEDRDKAIGLLGDYGYIAPSRGGRRRFASGPTGEDPKWQRWMTGRDVHIEPSAVPGRARVDMPDFDPDNPLAFYGDRLTIQSRSEIAERHLSDLEKFAPEVHETLRGHFAGVDGSGFYIGGDTGVPQLDDLGHLSGVRPRGWPEGSTWDDVAGAYNPTKRVCACGHTGRSGSTDTHSTALHEGSHALDDALGGISSRGIWTGLYNDLADGVILQPYFSVSGNPTGYLSESFAEAFGAYTGARTKSRDELIDTVGTALAGRAPIKPRNRENVGKMVDYFSRLERLMSERVRSSR